MRSAEVAILLAYIVKASTSANEVANRFVDGLLDRALTASSPYHEGLDSATLGKSVANLAQTVPRTPTIQLRARHARPSSAHHGLAPLGISQLTAPRRWLHKDMSTRAVQEDTIKNIDLILGPTTTLAPRAPRTSPLAPSLVQKDVAMPSSGVEKATLPKSLELPGKGEIASTSGQMLLAYRWLILGRFFLDYFGVKEDQPPWQGFFVLTDPYLKLFAVWGPFTAIAAYGFLVFLRYYFVALSQEP
jgi:hypothetical protein